MRSSRARVYLLTYYQPSCEKKKQTDWSEIQPWWICIVPSDGRLVTLSICFAAIGADRVCVIALLVLVICVST